MKDGGRGGRRRSLLEVSDTINKTQTISIPANESAAIYVPGRTCPWFPVEEKRK